MAAGSLDDYKGKRDFGRTPEPSPGVPDAERGQSVAASVLLEPGASAAPDELRARLKEQISAYKVPRHLFVDEDGTLPFTDTGKIDKRRLTELLAGRIAG